MRTFLQFFLGFIFTALLIIVPTSCGSDEEPEPPVLSSLNLSASSTRIDVTTDVAIQLNVVGKDQFGMDIELPSDPQFESDNDNVSVSQTGLVSANAVGVSIITVTVEDVQGMFTIEVWDSTAPRTEIYVSDVGINRGGPHRIIRYDENGGNPEVFISSNLSRPQDIVFLEDRGEVLVSNLATNNINRYDIETGAMMGSFATGINGPTRMDIGPDGLLYVIQWNGGPVKRYNVDGTFVDDFTTTSIDEAIGITWDNNDNLYVSSFNDGGAGFILKFDPQGNDMGTFVNTNLAGPTDIWFDDAGNLFANDWSGNSVVKFSSTGTFLETFISNVSQPEGVAILDNGDILIGASGTSSVRSYSSTGTLQRDLVARNGGGLVTPNAVVVRKVNFD